MESGVRKGTCSQVENLPPIFIKQGRMWEKDKKITGQELAINVSAMDNFYDMDNMLRKIYFIDNPIITFTQRIAAVFL